VSTKLSKITQY